MRRRAGDGAADGRRSAGDAAASLRTALGGVTAMALALAACATEPQAVAVPVQLELHQLRGDVADGFVELRVTNPGATELVIARATYVSSAWSAPMERVDEARIPPGARRNLRLELPDPTCATGELEHRATLVLADGTVVEGEPADPLGQLEALDDAECDLRAFQRDVASVAWLEPRIPVDGVGPATLLLEVAPVGGDGRQLGSVEEVPATPLLVPVDAADERIEALPVDLAIVAGAAPTVVEVRVAPGRCDLHAVAEDKQGTLFRVRAMHGDAAVTLVLPSPAAQRDALLDFVVASCSAAP